MKVEIYSDVVCPWCYIGGRRFARALEAFPRADEVEVVFRAFQLDPGAPNTPTPLREYLRKRYGAQAESMLGQAAAVAAEEGIRFDWDAAQHVNTFTAHRLLHLAEREYGAALQRALAESLFELYFTRGGDVSHHQTLAELAAAVGMDRARAAGYLDSAEGVTEVEAQIEEARRLGIRAVPTFVFADRFAVQGAQPVALFRRALEQVQAAAAGREARGE